MWVHRVALVLLLCASSAGAQEWPQFRGPTGQGHSDERGVCRVFDMTFTEDRWTLIREDADMFQRFVADLAPDRIAGRWEASDDRGTTWRKDFDLVFDRV